MMKHSKLYLVAIVFLYSMTVHECYASWAKLYDSGTHDIIYSIKETKDYGYIAGGLTNVLTTSGDKRHRVWLFKSNQDGQIDWELLYGVDGEYNCNGQYAKVIEQTQDGGYIVLSDASCYLGGTWLIKLNEDGTPAWQKLYKSVGIAQADLSKAIAQTSDSGYIIAGWYRSMVGARNDFIVIRLDSFGDIIWQKIYGGLGDEWASSVQQIPGNGFIVAGVTESFGAGETDLWILELDSEGKLVWQKAYGGTGPDGTYYSVFVSVSEDGYLLTSQTGSFGNIGWDLWLLNLDKTGLINWQKAYGGVDVETPTDVRPTADGGYIVVSERYYLYGPNRGMENIWITHLDENGLVNWEKTFFGGGSASPYSVLQTSTLQYLIAGSTYGFDSEGNFCSNCGSQGLLIKLDENGNLSNCPFLYNSEFTTFITEATITETTIEPQEGVYVYAENIYVEPEISASKTATICMAPEVIKVNIDIKPDSTTNSVNINDHGVIPVAILGNADFDVTQVDPAKCTLQGMSVKMVGKSNKLLCNLLDVNNDGYDDLLLKIEDLDGNFAEGQTEATLEGALYDGTPIEGTDTICIVP